MKIQITGKNLNLTKGIKSHVGKKFNKLQRYHSGVQYIEVLLEGDAPNVLATVKAGLPSVSDVIIKEKAENVHAVIEKAQGKTVKSLRRQKERLVRNAKPIRELSLESV